MRFFKGSARILITLISVLVLLAGCGREDEPAPTAAIPGPGAAPQSSAATTPEQYNPKIGTHGGRLIMSTIANPKSFNPIIAQETSTTAITGYIFEGLTTVSGITNEVEPNLARHWEVSEDGLTWTFHLRDDVKWNDGAPFTAADVLFTFNDLIYNEDIATSSRDIFTLEGKPVEVKQVDDHTVTFKTPVKFAPFLRAMGQEIMPRHLLEGHAKDGTFSSAFGVDSDPGDIVGTGPFKLDRYEPSQRVVLKRNPGYWKKDASGGGLPYLDGLMFLVVSNTDVALLKFKEGETDYYGLRGPDFPILKPIEREGGFTVYRAGPAFGTNWISFNQNPRNNPETNQSFVDPVRLKWFTNINFRRAVAHSLDKQSMINAAMNGLAYPQHGAMSPSAGFFYNENVSKYEFDPDKARKILSENGFKDSDGDGYVEDPDGNKIEFSLYTNSGNDIREKLADMVRKDLEGIGMQVHFTPLEFNNLVDKISVNYDWESILLGFTGGVEPHFSKNIWHSSGQLHEWNPRQEKPATQWEARIDEIFELGVQELDKDKRKVLYDEWQVIVSEQLPLIYTVLPESIFAVRDKFGNLFPTPVGGAFHNIEEIYIVK